uniref:Holin n=1 Tax=Streptomyces phage Kamino TaxID=3158857 RepID=A0AAU7GZN6_9CAUD
MTGKHEAPTNPRTESFVNLLLPLLPVKARPYAKAILALLGTVASVAVLVAADNQYVAAGVQILTALGVYAQPNGSTGEDEFPESGLPESAYQG